MSATVILAMTMISAAATIAIGGFDVLNTDPAPVAQAPGAPVDKRSVIEVLQDTEATVRAAVQAMPGPQGPVVMVPATVKEKTLGGTEAFRKFLHDTIASPMPKYEPGGAGDNGSTHWYFTSLIRYVCHRFTLETSLDERQKFLAALCLICRKHGDLVIKGADITESVANAQGGNSSQSQKDKWIKMRWGNRRVITLLKYDQVTEEYEACVINAKDQTSHYVATSNTEQCAAKMEFDKDKAAMNIANENLAKIHAVLVVLSVDAAVTALPGFPPDLIPKSGGSAVARGGAGRGFPGRGGPGRGLPGRGGPGRGAVSTSPVTTTTSPASARPAAIPTPVEIDRTRANMDLANELIPKYHDAVTEMANWNKYGKDNNRDRDSYYELMTVSAAEKNSSIKQYLTNSVRTFLPPCENVKGLLCVLAALVSVISGEVPDHLDRYVVSRFEAEDAWEHVLSGLKDHGANTDLYDKPVRPEEKRPPANAAKCPNRNDKRFKKQNGKVDEQKYKDAVALYNSINPGANCS